MKKNSMMTWMKESRQFLEDRTGFYILLILAVVFTSFALRNSSVYAASNMPLYNCVSPHCYGEVEWDNPIQGAATNAQVEFIKCGSCDGFVNNEIWLNDSYESNCVDPDNPNSDSHICWVEAGYTTYGSTDHHESSPCVQAPANCYFWADNRPGGGYHEHPVGNIPTSDYGQYVYLYIDHTGTSQTYTVDLIAPSGDYEDSSTGNSMSPNYITMGEELYGTSGASSPKTDFIDNEWYAYSSNAMHYQTNAVAFTYGNPPYARWITDPTSTNDGGVFQVNT